jgi:hypothetical protein
MLLAYVLALGIALAAAASPLVARWRSRPVVESGVGRPSVG